MGISFAFGAPPPPAQVSESATDGQCNSKSVVVTFRLSLGFLPEILVENIADRIICTGFKM